MSSEDRRQLRLLVVEDNRAHARLVEILLQEITFPRIELTCVQNLATALRHLELEGADVVLLDLSLPESRGLETFDAVHGRVSSIPIIVLTALDDERLAREAVRRGAQDYLIKGEIGASLLARSMVYAIERKRSEQELRRRGTFLEALNQVASSALEATSVSGLLASGLDCALDVLGLELGACWISEHSSVRGLPGQVCRAVASDSGHPGAGSMEPLVVEDLLAAGDQVLSDLMKPSGARALVHVPLGGGRHRRGGLLVADTRCRAWSPEECSLLAAVGRQLQSAADRLALFDGAQEHARRVEQIIGSVPEGVILLGGELEVLSANPAGHAALDLLSDRGRPKLTHLGPDRIQRFLSAPPPGLWHELEIQEPEHRHFKVLAKPILTTDRGDNWVLVIQDITLEKEKQDREQRQQRLASLGQLAAGVAHDFNNMISIVSGHTQLVLQRHDLPDAAREHLGAVCRQIMVTSELIHEILDFCKNGSVKGEPVALLAAVGQVVELVSSAMPGHVQLTLEADPGEYVVEGDSVKLQQVVTNLILNARDALQERRGRGKITVGLERIEPTRLEVPSVLEPAPRTPGKAAPRSWIRMIVSDNGPGIPAPLLDRLFEPFFSTKSRGLGAGLGLARVYGIVRQHCGYVDVTSSAKTGTRFSVYLPASTAQPRRPEPGQRTAHDPHPAHV